MFVLIYLSIDIYAGQQMEIFFKDWQFVNLKFATLFITNSLYFSFQTLYCTLIYFCTVGMKFIIKWSVHLW